MSSKRVAYTSEVPTKETGMEECMYVWDPDVNYGYGGFIMAAKRTGELIPLCHTLALDAVTVEFSREDAAIRVTATTSCTGRTGVEMEAMAAASVALLTLYDMGKAVDRAMVIEGVRLIEKTGGKSGHWRADP